MDDSVYANAAEFRMEESSSPSHFLTGKTRDPQTGTPPPSSAGPLRCYRLTAVCLGLLCVLLLVLCTALVVRHDQLHTENNQLHTQNDQLHAQNNQTMTQKDQLQTQRDQLQTQRDQLQTQRDQLLAENNQLRTESNQLLKTSSLEEQKVRWHYKKGYFHPRHFTISGYTLGTWNTSRAYCQSLGADLLKVTTLEEQMFINGWNTPVWIGLRHAGSQWTWVDNTELSRSYWEGAEQSAMDVGENCVMSVVGEPGRPMTATHTWHNYPCDFTAFAVCVKP
ncbi:hypothetical protein ACEWY4_016014 [Coilia grayii]|uniref:C-type lectin domain-containing protein n=1 Tax=Coilia grayii TaxID=363190 RepID=A0ABD1JQH3_9TELE